MPISGGPEGRGHPGHRRSADRVVAPGAELRALHDRIRDVHDASDGAGLVLPDRFWLFG